MPKQAPFDHVAAKQLHEYHMHTHKITHGVITREAHVHTVLVTPTQQTAVVLKVFANKM
jgi:hypothetical protein